MVAEPPELDPLNRNWNSPLANFIRETNIARRGSKGATQPSSNFFFERSGRYFFAQLNHIFGFAQCLFHETNLGSCQLRPAVRDFRIWQEVDAALGRFRPA